MAEPVEATVAPLSPVTLGGRRAARYRLHVPYAYTGDEEIDARLSSFEAAIAVPGGRAAAAPVVLVLEGITAPYTRAGYVVPALLDMGMACVLFETPLSGTRALAPPGVRNLGAALGEVVGRGVDLSAGFMGRLMRGTATDARQVLRLAATRHGLAQADGGRVALFGISFGCLLHSFAFTHDGLGGRLLGAIGHGDLPTFARGLFRQIRGYLSDIPGLDRVPLEALLGGGAWRMLRPMVARRFGAEGTGLLHFLRLLALLGAGGRDVQAFNPAAFAGRVEASRPARLLLGRLDEVARVEDGARFTGRLPNGAVRAEDGLAHGYVVQGTPYQERIRRFLREELSDF